jgi:hypothetical protein
MDLRRFPPFTDHNVEGNYNDIRGPLQELLKRMKKGGVHDVPDIGVVFGEAMLLVRNMEKDVKDFFQWLCRSYQGLPQVALYSNGWSPTSSLGHNYKKRHLDYTPSILSNQARRSCGFTTIASSKKATKP